MRGKALALVLAASVATACGHSELHEVVFRTAPRTVGPVEVYLVGQAPSRPFDELALLQLVSSGDQAEPAVVLAALSQRASELGCDALVRVRIDVGLTTTNAYGVCVRTQAAHAAAP